MDKLFEKAFHLCEQILDIDVFNLMETKYKNGFSGTLGEYERMKTIHKAWSFHQMGNDETAIRVLLINAKNWIADRLTRSTLQEMSSSIAIHVTEYYQILNQFNSNTIEYYKNLENSLQKISILNAGKLLEQYSIYEIDEILAKFRMDTTDNKKFQVSRYSGVENLHFNEWQLKDHILLTSNLYRTLQSLKNLEEDGTVFYPIFVIDHDELAYSYFVFAAKEGNNILLLSDQINFKNPKNKYSGRNPYRRLDNKLGSSNYLPYNLIDWVHEQRKNCTSLVIGNCDEFYTFPVKDIEPISVLFILNLVEHGFFSSDIKQIGTLYEMVQNQKLIGPVQSSGDYFNTSDECKEFMNNSMINFKHLPAVQPIATVLPRASHAMLVSTLVTPEATERLVNWYTRQDIANDIYTTLRKTEFTDKGLLGEMLLDSDNFERLIQLAAEYHQVNIKIKGELSQTGFGARQKQVEDYYHTCWIGDYPSCSGILLSKSHLNADYCGNCGSRTGAKFFNIECKSWRLLQYACDCEREELPINFQNYNAHIFIPYIGNTILDDVDPVLNACTNEPMQRSEPNRFFIKYRLCRKCLETFDYRQKRKPECWITIDGREIIEILEQKPK